METEPAPLPDVVPAAGPRASAPDPSAWGELRELWGARGLLGAFVRNDLRQRYVGSSIGFFWTVVNPIVELVTYGGADKLSRVDALLDRLRKQMSQIRKDQR